MFGGKMEIFNLDRTSAYTTEKIEGELIPPSFTPRLITKGSETKSFIRRRQELSEKRASTARMVFGGALYLYKIETAFDLSTDGNAFFKSMKQE
jgi:hypothetical protein